MGKIRVYELAKELGLGNKELVQKLQEIGYSVKSHSSTIEDFLVKEIKNRLGATAAPAEEKTRPTVIRRRKKVVPTEEFEEETTEGGMADDEDSEASASAIEQIEQIEQEIPEVHVEIAQGDQITEVSRVEAPQSIEVIESGQVEETTEPITELSSGIEATVAESAEHAPESISGAREGETETPPTDEMQDVTAEQEAVTPMVEEMMPAVEEASTQTAVLQEPQKDAGTTQPEQVEPVDLKLESQPTDIEVMSVSEEKSKQAAEAETFKPVKEEPEVQATAEEAEKLIEPEVKNIEKSRKKQDQRGPRKVASEAIVKPDAKIKRIEKTTSEPAKIISRPKVVETPPPPPPKQVVEPKAPQTPPAGKSAQAPPVPKSPRTPPVERRVHPAPTPRPVVDIAPPATEGKKGKKKKKGRDTVETETEVSRKKGSRRREIIEREELYEKSGWDRPGRGRKQTKVVKKSKRTEITVPKAIKRRIKVVDAISIADLAKKMGVKVADIMRKLISMGVMANMNQAIDYDTAALVATEFDYEVEPGAFDEGELLHNINRPDEGKVIRPPVVTVMGHVDHGKTSLLDAIRQTNVIDGEAGGITQHIGAYHVEVAGGNVTFLDTPGHEAFTAMRARGAKITDIVVLIVAADDGVMQQTREAADHALAAKVPIIVAVNKIDKPGAEPDRIRREVSEMGLVPEAWGGDTIFVDVSAKTGEGISDLLDMILLQAEVLELKATPTGRATGRIVEARLDKGRGPVATLLVQDGLLKQGDPYVCGVHSGKIRAMFDDKGERVDQAGPSIPVEIQGIGGVPQAGDEFVVVEDEKTAKQISQHRSLKQRESELLKTSKLTLENLFDNIKEGAIKELNLVLKTDVQGSLEAITDATSKLGNQDIKVNVIHSSTGAISESDIMLASASNALIVGFGIRASAKIQELAEQEKIQIRYYDIIYKLIEEIKEAMAGMLEPLHEERILGRAEVREAFHVSKVGTIAGSAVTDGKVVRGAHARLLRDNVVIYDGKIDSLKRFKDDAKEVTTGYECGIGLENYNDIKSGDVIEAYMLEEVAATLD